MSSPTDASVDIIAGQRNSLPQEGRRSQRIAFTLASIKVFPMTHHVEAVALLEKA
ncbi:hypothetical protein AB0F44_16795 [Nocardioides sp. NPDC023903]|uniref:hypothetical protein n=1 Tax=Nocardioides sp. NPDC023903 TaxID=3157195 RepID=UPI0033C1190A